MIESYPLYWPEAWRRTQSQFRQRGRFNKKTREYYGGQNGQPQSSWLRTKDLTIAEGISRLLAELEAMGATRDDVIISTNLRLRMDGLPRSDQREPEDPGAAVYWQRDGEQMRCMAIDRYERVADNIGALAATLGAMRAIERHGGAEILNRAFRGFAALPEQTSSTWRHIFGFGERDTLTPEDVDRKFAELVHVHHPDKGGNADKFQEILKAREAARNELFAEARA